MKQGKRIEIAVGDNGKGFEINEISKNTHGSGFSSIRNRLALYNGKLQIQSSPGKGATVKISLDRKN